MNRQAGFTLVELLVAMTIGMLVILAAFRSLDTFGVATATVTKRTDNTQRARLAMDGLIRALRSQVCLGPGQSSLVAASPTSITFVTDLGDGTTPPQRRTVTYDPATRRLGEQRVTARTTTTPYDFSGPTVPGPTLSGVDPTESTNGVFGYWAYDTAGTPAEPKTRLGGGGTLTAIDLQQAVRITVGFRVGPAVGSTDRGTGVTFADEALLRTVDPSDPVPLPLCS